MRITPYDIQNKQFPVRFRGFEMQEVSDFLEMLREEIEEVLRENASLKEQMSKYEARLKEYQQMEDTLKETLVSSQEMIKTFKENAKKEVELTLQEAEMNAAKIIRGAQDKAIKIHEDIADLKGVRRHVREELIRLLENHMRMVNFDIEVEEKEPGEA